MIKFQLSSHVCRKCSSELWCLRLFINIFVLMLLCRLFGENLGRPWEISWQVGFKNTDWGVQFLKHTHHSIIFFHILKKTHIHIRTTWSQKAIGHIKLNKDLNFHAIHTLMSSISIIHAQGAIVVKGRPKFFDFPLFSHSGRPLIITPKDKLMII